MQPHSTAEYGDGGTDAIYIIGRIKNNLRNSRILLWNSAKNDSGKFEEFARNMVSAEFKEGQERIFFFLGEDSIDDLQAVPGQFHHSRLVIISNHFVIDGCIWLVTVQLVGKVNHFAPDIIPFRKIGPSGFVQLFVECFDLSSRVRRIRHDLFDIDGDLAELFFVYVESE